MSHSGNSSRKRRNHYRRKTTLKALPKIFFCGDPHGKFDHINAAVRKYRPDAIVILGDLQPNGPIEQILGEALSLTQVWWIPGNHDTDTEEYYDRLWNGPLASHNLHGKVAVVAGIRIAGLGGVFRGQIWMPEANLNYQSASAFIRKTSKINLWRGGLPRRHRTSIFPKTYESLERQRADVLVTHEAASSHRKGFLAIDELAKRLHVRWHFHGHQHEDHDYGLRDGIYGRAVGYRGIVDLEGHVIVQSELDPRDQITMQQAGDEPPLDLLDSVEFDLDKEVFYGRRRFFRKQPRTGQKKPESSQSLPRSNTLGKKSCN